MYYLDTNICSYFLNGKYEKVREHISKINPCNIKIPVIVKSELLYGAYKSPNSERITAIINSFLDKFEVEDFSDDMSMAYAKIRTELEKEGKPIGPNDLLIASMVVSRGGILVTNNEKEFSRVPGLQVVNWVK